MTGAVLSDDIMEEAAAAPRLDHPTHVDALTHLWLRPAHRHISEYGCFAVLARGQSNSLSGQR